MRVPEWGGSCAVLLVSGLASRHVSTASTAYAYASTSHARVCTLATSVSTIVRKACGRCYGRLRGQGALCCVHGGRKSKGRKRCWFMCDCLGVRACLAGY
eukprot:6841288-Alexandrium_andersonii.AAC.1